MKVGREDEVVAPPAAPAERAVRRWLVTLMVLGAGGIGAFLLSERGQQALRRRLAWFEEDPETWSDWNQAAQTELERIQSALNQIAQSLGPHGEPTR
jgi:hypothetical protein